MIKIVDKKNCSGCNACVSICPVQAIKMISDDEHFLYPSVDQNKCINCGRCEHVCPYLHPETNKTHLTAFACYSNDTATRLTSSSGGIFSILAEKTIDQNGVVVGAVMDKNYRGVHHIIIKEKKDLPFLRGSKYLQSKIGNSYTEVKKILDSDRSVFFTGTPCQIRGLKSFLGKDYAKLLCMDVICHGVPSDLVWDKYLQEFENQFHAPLATAEFRYKQAKRSAFGQDHRDENKSFYVTRSHDKFMRVFLKDWCLRPSCYNCIAKLHGYASDLTIGDFWGISIEVPNLNDEMGTSALIIRTEKGLNAWNEILSKTTAQEVNYSQIYEHNTALEIPVKMPEQRHQFMQDIHTMTFSAVHDKYLGTTKSKTSKSKTTLKGSVDNCSYGILLTFKKDE